MKFRKKPVVIEARQLTSGNWLELSKWTGATAYYNDYERLHFIIHTLEGDMLASIGDWIIQGVKGEFYSCKSDIFEATYEQAE